MLEALEGIIQMEMTVTERWRRGPGYSRDRGGELAEPELKPNKPLYKTPQKAFESAGGLVV